jgi:hypothetical protein
MEQSPSCESNRYSAGQEIPCLLWNPNVHCRFRKSPQIPRPCVKFRNKLFYTVSIFSPLSDLQAVGPPILGCSGPAKITEHSSEQKELPVKS